WKRWTMVDCERSIRHELRISADRCARERGHRKRRPLLPPLPVCDGERVGVRGECVRRLAFDGVEHCPLTPGPLPASGERGKIRAPLAPPPRDRGRSRYTATLPVMANDNGSLLQHPAYVRYWFARVASGFAFQMLSVAAGWQVYDLTHSAFDLGLIGLVQFVPSLLLVLPAGHVADHYDRRRIVLVCVIVEAA